MSNSIWNYIKYRNGLFLKKGYIIEHLGEYVKIKVDTFGKLKYSNNQPFEKIEIIPERNIIDVFFKNFS